MKNNIIYILFAIFGISNIYAQQGSIQKNCGDLSYLIDQFNNTKAEQLPEWIFEPQGNGRYVGVSDPNSTAERAAEQVLLRAWMLSQLDYQHMIEAYFQEYHHTVEFKNKLGITLTALGLKDVMLIAKRTYRSKYGEFFVEFFESSISNPDPNLFIFNVDGKLGVVFEEFSEFNETNDTSSINQELKGYISYPTLKDYISHSYDSNTITNASKCNYADTIMDSNKNTGQVREIQGVVSSTGVELHPSSLENGYWLSLINSMLSSASDFAFMVNSNIDTQSSSYFQSNSASDSQLSIIDSVASNTFRLALSSVSIRDNRAYIEWNIELVDDKSK